MAFGIEEAFTAESNIFGSYFAKQAYDDYADFLRGIEMNMPTSMYGAESIYRDRATQGLAGKETIRRNIESVMPTTLTMAKEQSDSPTAVLDMISKQQANLGGEIRQLDIQDEMARRENEARYANFLQKMAAQELSIDEFNKMIDILAEQEELTGKLTYIQGVSEGVSGIGGSIDEFLNDYMMTSGGMGG